jgi:hypothetical protein
VPPRLLQEQLAGQIAMKDLWYADNRDLVKWSVLLTLADRLRLRHILQVLYHRPTEWASIEIDGETVAIPTAVIAHFRQVGAISAIKGPCPVEVVSGPFTDRGAYHRNLVDRIRSRSQTPGIVFLDPDNGLQPRKASLKHVLDSELAEVWHELDPGDVLALYQHQTNRNGRQWIEPKKQQFETAIGIPLGSARLAQAEKIARDVVFFYVQKPASRRGAEGDDAAARTER